MAPSVPGSRPFLQFQIVNLLLQCEYLFINIRVQCGELINLLLEVSQRGTIRIRCLGKGEDASDTECKNEKKNALCQKSPVNALFLNKLFPWLTAFQKRHPEYPAAEQQQGSGDRNRGSGDIINGVDKMLSVICKKNLRAGKGI